MAITLILVALSAATITFLSLIWFYGPLLSSLAAMVAANGMAITVIAVAELRRRSRTEPTEEAWDELAQDQRQSTRLATFVRGSLEWNDGRSRSDCIVHNLSATGARLGLPESVTLQEDVELHVADQNRTARAKVRWRMGDQVGVELLDQAIEDLDSGDLKEQNAKLRAEVDRLRKILDDQWAPPNRSRK